MEKGVWLYSERERMKVLLDMTSQPNEDGRTTRITSRERFGGKYHITGQTAQEMMGRYHHFLKIHHLAESSVGSLYLEAATREFRPSMGQKSGDG